MNISERIFYLLEKQNKTAVELGKSIGVASSSINGWKNGSFPSSKYIVEISEFLNVSVEYLLTGNDEKVDYDEEVTQYNYTEKFDLLPDVYKERILERIQVFTELSELEMQNVAEEKASPYIYKKQNTSTSRIHLKEKK